MTRVREALTVDVRVWWGLFALWNAAIFWFSSRSTLPDGGFSFPGLDKVQHGAAFAAGAFILMNAWPLRPERLAADLAVRACVMLLIAISDEVHQTFTPGRSGNDAGDLLADLCGTATGLLAGLWLMRRASQQQPSRG